MFEWTKERDDTLARMLNEGKFFSEIAKALKTTRGSAIGRAYRLKLPPAFLDNSTATKAWHEQGGTRGRGRNKAGVMPAHKIIAAMLAIEPNRDPADIAFEARCSVNTVLNVRAKLLPKTERRHPRRVRLMVVPADAPQPMNLTLMDLERHHCRWPVTEDSPFTFCGHGKAPDSSYCPYHTILATEQSAPNPRQRYVNGTGIDYRRRAA